MHSKTVYCTPMQNYSSVHMGDLKHLLSLALHLMEFMLEKHFYFDQCNFYANFLGFFYFEFWPNFTFLFEQMTKQMQLLYVAHEP